MGNRFGARARAVGVVAILTVISLAIGANAQAQEDDPPEPPDLTAEPLAPDEVIEGNKSPSSRIAQTDPELLGRTDSTPINVLVKLDYDSVATYRGSVDGLEATSPAVTGDELTGQSQAETEYDGYVADLEAAFLDDLAAVTPDALVGQSLRTVYGGVAVTIPADTVDEVLAIDGVVAVQKDELRQPLTDSSPEFVGAPTIYDALGTTVGAGRGVIYGNLDTGIWPEHPAFAPRPDLPPIPPTFSGVPRECNYGDNPLTPAVDQFVCNNKLIGGAHFTDTYDVVEGDDPYAGTARDGDGHGTHTSTTSAGSPVDAVVFGVDRGEIHGLAPGAHVIEYKVCGPQGCFSSDSAAAVAQAILDGVNVINFSISGGTNPATDPVELAFLDAYGAGVFVAASAGNSGPGVSTVNHLSPWVTTVAASTQTREFATTLDLTADNGDTFTADGASITDGAGPLPVVLAQNVPGYNPTDTAAQRANCANPPTTPNVFDGLIVACQRGGQARVWKGYVVTLGGGEGMVLYNAALQDVETDNHWLPTVHLPDGRPFVAFMNGHTGVTGSFAAGEARDGQGDVMAAFSSRGPGGHFIKPDITAPGVQILAGASPTPPAPDPVDGGSPPGELFQAIAGTSMSSPHIAGAAILLKALHPEWTPGQIKSAIMTTATTAVVKENLTTPADPFDFGAGRVDLNLAGNPGLTFDATAADMLRLGNDPVNAVQLNQPSINAPVMPGRLTTTRVATNVSGRRLRYDIETTSPLGTSISVSRNTLNVPAGATAAFGVTIASTAASGQFFGEIRLVPRNEDYPTLHIPVAFRVQQGAVTLTSACSPTAILRGNTTICTITATNRGTATTQVDLTTSTNNRLRLTQATIPATLQDGRARLTTTLVGDRPGIPRVDPLAALGGYLPLASLGVTPTAVGDETIANFNVPAFPYNGRTWTSIGVLTNGYVVVGGGTTEDNECCDLPQAASPTRPNNILAPFWTDLNGTGAPGIFVAVLTDGTNRWLVVEWQVRVFGTTDLRAFQTWIGLSGDASPAQDIEFAYSTAQAAPAMHDYRVGAENEFGEGDVTRFLPATDQRVTSTDATPGGSVTYNVVALGARVGAGLVTTEMTSAQVPGATVVRTPVQVNPPG